MEDPLWGCEEVLMGGGVDLSHLIYRVCVIWAPAPAGVSECVLGGGLAVLVG